MISVRNLIVHPRIADLEMGSAEWFDGQRRMIHEKPLIRRCYDLWYRRLLSDADSVPNAGRLAVVELGSGSSYIREIRPTVITSDITAGQTDLVLDGRQLPFRDNSVGALLLTHVFHHIPDVHAFFSEALRVLAPGGVISLVECAHTPFARFFFGRIHPEPYDDSVAEWNFPSQGRMLDSNQALSWIVFKRDRKRFEQMYPGLFMERCTYLPWFSYLMSGGVNLRSAVPSALTGIVRRLDTVLRPLDGVFAIHWHISIRKVRE